MNTFLNKVQAERRVLSAVNRYTPGKRQLRGLSSNAIANWASANSIGSESQVIVTLTGLGDLCSSLSDRSNENFNKIPEERIKLIEEQLQVLDKHINCLTTGSTGPISENPRTREPETEHGIPVTEQDSAREAPSNERDSK